MTGLMAGDLDVSRETSEKLQQYTALLRKWTRSINLISASTVDDAWNRHIVDSAQIFGLIPPDSTRLTDLGSGGGLPGIVLAIMAQHHYPALTVTLVESDQRKSAFLRTAARELDLQITIVADRIETIPSASADVLTARALAPLPDLLGHADRILAPGGIALFMKGRQASAEIAAARRKWQFSFDLADSRTDRDASILMIKDIRRAAD